MQKIDKSTKLKLLGLILLSHTSLYLLVSEKSVSKTSFNCENSTRVLNRVGYTPLIIEAELRAELNQSSPMVITNSSRSLYIDYVFIVDKYNSQDTNDGFSFQETGSTAINQNQSKYLVQIKQKDLPKVLNRRDLIILPLIDRKFLIKKTRRKSYEVIL